MDARQYNACVNQLRKQCDKLIDGGYHCAVVYSSSNGLLLTHGTEVIRDHVRQIGDTVINDPRWLEQGGQLEVHAVGTTATIPRLQKPVNKMSLMDLRTTIPQLLKADKGRSNIGWGKDEQKPVWWPEGVPFVNPNKQPDGYQGNWMTALRRVVRACLSHHGYCADSHFDGFEGHQVKHDESRSSASPSSQRRSSSPVSWTSDSVFSSASSPNTPATSPGSPLATTTATDPCSSSLLSNSVSTQGPFPLSSMLSPARRQDGSPLSVDDCKRNNRAATPCLKTRPNRERKRKLPFSP